MKKTINRQRFINSFNGIDRFSPGGLHTLFSYLEEYEESEGEELELDPIGFCCEYTEYESLEELRQDYPDIKTVEELEDKTIVIPIEESKGLIIQNF